VKSGSDGEGASNSQSDSSASLGSLKAGGESPISTSLPGGGGGGGVAAAAALRLQVNNNLLFLSLCYYFSPAS